MELEEELLSQQLPVRNKSHQNLEIEEQAPSMEYRSAKSGKVHTTKEKKSVPQEEDAFEWRVRIDVRSAVNIPLSLHKE